MRGAARKPNRSLFDQLEFCFELAEPLPSADSLRAQAVALLNGLNARALAGRLRVEWNARMRSTVGRAHYERALISLNPILEKFGRAETDRTLRHELAHLLAQFRAGRTHILPHGIEWRRACRDLGIEGERVCHKLPLAVGHIAPRFVYHCMNCQQEFPRVRRIRRATACLTCCRKFAGGHYDERFRLRLANSAPRPKFSRVFTKSFR